MCADKAGGFLPHNPSLMQTPPRKRHAPVSKVAGTDADSSLNLGDDDDDKDKVKGVVKRYDSNFATLCVCVCRSLCVGVDGWVGRCVCVCVCGWVGVCVCVCVCVCAHMSTCVRTHQDLRTSGRITLHYSKVCHLLFLSSFLQQHTSP